MNERRLRVKPYDLVLTIIPLPFVLIHPSFQPQLVASLPYKVTLRTTQLSHCQCLSTFLPKESPVRELLWVAAQ